MPRSEEEKLEHKTNMLRTTNGGLANEIEQLGGDIDLATARVEFLMEFLEKEGIVTPLQRRQEQYRWEEGLRPQLIRVRDALKERVQAQARAHQEMLARGPHVVTDRAEIPEGGPKLIIPGQ